MIQPRIDQRVTVIDGSDLESGVSGTVIRLPRAGFQGVKVQTDSGRTFTMFPDRLRLSEKST